MLSHLKDLLRWWHGLSFKTFTIKGDTIKLLVILALALLFVRLFNYVAPPDTNCVPEYRGAYCE